MAWITQTYMENMIGVEEAAQLWPSTPIFNQFEVAARATVISSIEHAGYTAPDTLDLSSVTGGFLGKLIGGVLLRDGYSSRNGTELPAMAQEAVSMLDAIYDKRLPIPGLTPSTLDGYGGNKFSKLNSPYQYRYTYFGRDDLKGF